MERKYPSKKIFFLMMISPALGGFGLGLFNLLGYFFSGKGDFFSLLVVSFVFSLYGFLFYFLPMIAFCGAVIWFRCYAKLKVYFLLSFIGGGVALLWPLLLFNKGLGDYEENYFINLLFFIAGFFSIFIVSFIALPKK